MATLVVRKVEEETVRRLKERARAAGRSAEAEHRVILEEALRPKRTGADLWREMRESGPLLADDDEFFKILDSLDQPAEPFEFTD
jgi:plasmid stability protein